MPELTIVTNLAVAALVGLAVGIEREWSGHATGPHARFAGTRTFFLLGLTSGVAGVLVSLGRTAAGVVLLAGAAALAVAAYVAAARRGGPGEEAIEGTTEAAALVVVALGLLAGLGHLRLASGAAVIVLLALVEKARVRRLVSRIDPIEMRSALAFAALALVVLPLLPSGSYGPLGGVRPRALWTVVLLFSGLDFLGWMVRRAVGAARGFGIAGLLGGLVSSTAVTLHFSRRSRSDPELAPSLAAGVLGACTVLIPRVTIVSAILNPPVALALLPYLAPPLIAGVAITALALRHHTAESGAAEDDERNPLRLWSAIRMAIAFQAVLMVIAWVRTRWGASGILTSAAVLGLTDVDALTLAMTRLGVSTDAVALAARAIAVGILSNTAMKLVLTLALGSPRFRLVASGGLALLGAVLGAGLWLVGR